MQHALSARTILRLVSPNPPRRANHFCLSKIVSSPSLKNISVLQKLKSGYIACHPVPPGGAFRERHERRDGLRWTRRRARRAMPKRTGEVVWFRHPNGRCQVRVKARATVAKVQGSPRRARISHKPLRRESRMPPLDLYARVPPTSTLSHTRPRVQRAPGFPCAL